MNGPELHLRMLVVDDDEIDRARVRRLLARTPVDADIKEAASGAEALALVKTYPFDCVVLDNQLGDSSGAELLPKLHQEAQQDCPIIMITGAGSETLAVKAMQDGASDYLAKTQLSAECLVRAVRLSLQRYRLLNEQGTVHKQLEQRVEEQAAAIRQSERDLRAVMDNSPAAMGYWDREQRCRFGNVTLGEWFGVDTENLLGSHLRDVLGSELYAAIWPAVQTALGGGNQAFEKTIPASCRAPERHAQMQFRPDVAEDGMAHGFYITMSDVTQIKAAQARAEDLLKFSEAVIENSPIGIAVFRGDGTCMQANSALIEAIGESLNSSTKRHFSQLVSWSSCGIVATAEATLKDGLTRHTEVVLPRPGKSVRLACSLARVDSGDEVRLLVIAQDITEQELAHAALVAARDAATSAARAKSVFLANMSHEIRTPMNAIVGLSRLALEDELPPKARDFLDNVHKSAVALMGILDDVLDYSKIEAGRLHIDRIRFDLHDTLHRVAALFRARTEQKSLRFLVDISPRVPRYVMGDPLRLSQILNNLVGNAVKFTEKGQIHVQVDVADVATAQPGFSVSFKVIDTGIGLDAQQCSVLFDAFVQGDDSITRRFGGTGLGLAICKRLTQMMDGDIGVNSRLGIGSEFWFVIRLEPASDPPGADPAPFRESESAQLPTGKSSGLELVDRARALQVMATPLHGVHILLAEDNKLNQIVAMEFLRRAGLTVTTVENGAQAVEAIRNASPGQYSAVLMDMNMPVMDGLEATRRIHGIRGSSTPPVIGMTAAVLPEDRARCADAGMVDHVSKPLVPEDLIQVLLKWIPWKQDNASNQSPLAAPPQAFPAGSLVDTASPSEQLDLSALRRRLFGNETLLREVLRTFAKEEADTGRVLAELLAQGQSKRALEKTHDLKGTAANLGALAIATACANLENALRKGAPVDAALADLQKALDEGLDVIGAVNSKLDGTSQGRDFNS